MAIESSIYSEIIHWFGSIDDHKILEILELQPSRSDLEVAASFCAGMTDVMGEERQPLAGKVARIYDIVRQDELSVEESRQP